MDATEAARAFVNERFPNCLVAFLGGSVVRREATKSSDLDIVIITAEEKPYYNESLYAFGWPIQVFVHDRGFYKVIFEQEAKKRRPVQALMCFEGDIIKDSDGLAEQIKNFATVLLEKGPDSLSQDEIDARRYTLTDRLNDFIDSNNNDECVFIINELVASSSHLFLHYRRSWVGDGKQLYRSLYKVDPVKAQQLAEAVQKFYQTGEKDGLIEFVDGVLDLVGGKLFEGYSGTKHN